MTNTSPDMTTLRVQTLNTYNVTRNEHEPATQFLRDDRVELGSVVLYNAQRDDVTVSGIFDTRTGLADVDARDTDGNVLVHISEMSVDRHGLASFEIPTVTARSLGRIAEIGFAWAELAVDEAAARATESDEITESTSPQPAELISA